MQIVYNSSKDKSVIYNHIEESLKYIMSAISCINDVDKNIPYNQEELIENLKRTHDSLKNYKENFRITSEKYNSINDESKMILNRIQIPIIKDKQPNITKK